MEETSWPRFSRRVWPSSPLGLQHSLVAGFGNDLAHKLVQRQAGGFLAQVAVHGVKAAQRAGGPAQRRVQLRMGDDLHHRQVLCGGQLGDLFNGGGADLAGRLVDDAPQAHVIPRVDDDRQVGVDVLDLLAVKEPLAAYDAVRDAGAGKVGLDGVGLGVHAVEHRVVPQAGPLAQMLADDLGDVLGLVGLAGGGVVVDLGAVAVFGPQRLALAAVVVLDDRVGGVQDVGGGAVVLLQADGLCALEMLLEVEDILDGGAAEAVDGLVVVAHHADIVVPAAQQPHQMELGDAGVLVLVHHHVANFCW